MKLKFRPENIQVQIGDSRKSVDSVMKKFSRSVMNYAAPIWSPSLSNINWSSNNTRLTQLQRLLAVLN